MSKLRPSFNGTDSEYILVHNWIKKIAGKPVKYEGENCQGRSLTYQWANISGEYKREIKDWKQLCVSCHKKFDITDNFREKIGRRSLGNTYRRRAVIQIDTNRQVSYVHESGEHAAKALGILKTSINNCLRGHTKTAGGFRWQYKET